MQSPPSRRTRRWLIALALVAAVAAGALLPLGAWTAALTALLAGLGPLGFALFVGVFVAWGLVLPKGPLVAVAGAAFGLVNGLLAVYIATTIVMVAGYLLARRFGRARAQAWVAHHPWAAACERALARRGVRLVFLLRLSPVIPGHLQNYLYGLSRIGLRDCLLASWLGILPGTAVLVGTGALLAQGAQAPAWAWTATALGLAATVVAGTVLARAARAELQTAPAR